MQYILTQEEYDSLKNKVKEANKLPSVAQLQELCTLAANKIVVETGWAKGSVWGCILTEEEEHYCDECPAQKACPYEYKSWSK